MFLLTLRALYVYVAIEKFIVSSVEIFHLLPIKFQFFFSMPVSNNQSPASYFLMSKFWDHNLQHFFINAVLNKRTIFVPDFSYPTCFQIKFLCTFRMFAQTHTVSTCILVDSSLVSFNKPRTKHFVQYFHSFLRRPLWSN